MPLAGFEPVGERPQTHALDRAVTGTGDTKVKLKQLQLAKTGANRIEENCSEPELHRM